MRPNDYFNPLPRKEGDYYLRGKQQDSLWHFNPLPRKEGDVLSYHKKDSHSITIHSLVKRETSAATAGRLTEHFNPLPRKEGDAVGKMADYQIILFQSTPS